MSNNPYKKYTEQQLADLNSNYLIDSWSFSKVSEFARNEKAFEMSNIYGHRGKSSASSIAGTAYHYALDIFFGSLKNNETVDITFLEMAAFEKIEETPANFWKLQKTTPTVEECQKKACKLSSELLRNFMSEVGIYTDDLAEVLFVEVYFNEFLTINGVDIPLPCHGKVDLVIRTKSGKIAVIDHKSKGAFTDEEELKLAIGRQAITYVNGIESKFPELKVDEVWFVENKYSKNSNKAPQLNCFKVSITPDTRKLYEALLYEPLRRMVQAVSDPDYVYMINDSDNFVDKAEVYDFWAKTMIAEIEDFSVLPSKKEMIEKRMKKIRDSSIININPKIIKEFRENAAEFIRYDLSNKNMTQEEKIQHVLRSFGIITKVSHILQGCSSTTCLLEVSAGQKISAIHSHKLDIANVLDVSSVRVSKDLIVYEGKSYLGIEYSKQRDGDVFFDPSYLKEMKIPIGKDNFGNIIHWDLNNQSTPHALVCGGTGSGKSVSIKSTIEYALLAGVDEIIILDPKFEFTSYNSNPKISVFQEIKDIEAKAEELVGRMNGMIKSGITKKILIVLDEFADAYLMASKGKYLEIKEAVQDGYYKPVKLKTAFGETMSDPKPRFKMKVVGHKNSLEDNIQSLLQKGRSSGFRLILATQRADTKTISGNAKVNLPVRISFRVQKQIDSLVILDQEGAETLTGRGDGLLSSPEYPDIIRFQAFYKP